MRELQFVSHIFSVTRFWGFVGSDFLLVPAAVNNEGIVRVPRCPQRSPEFCRAALSTPSGIINVDLQNDLVRWRSRVPHCSFGPEILSSPRPSLDGLIVPSDFDAKKISKRRSEDLMKEFTRLAPLKWQTIAHYGAGVRQKLCLQSMDKRRRQRGQSEN